MFKDMVYGTQGNLVDMRLAHVVQTKSRSYKERKMISTAFRLRMCDIVLVVVDRRFAHFTPLPHLQNQIPRFSRV